MSTPDAIRELKEIGYTFRLTDDGQIIAVGRPGPDARFLLDLIKEDHDGAVECLHRYSLLDAVAIGRAIKSGKAVLTGKVIYHRKEDTVTVPWKPVSGDLNEYRKSLRTELERRLRELEMCSIDELTSDETARLADEYGRCWRLLHIADR